MDVHAERQCAHGPRRRFVGQLAAGKIIRIRVNDGDILQLTFIVEQAGCFLHEAAEVIGHIGLRLLRSVRPKRP